MPSGAKKRKAAKKKKVQQANTHPNSSSAHSHGDDEVKYHDEKDSDGGEVSSPASQDHHNHQHPFTEEEEEEVEKREHGKSVQSIVPEKNSVEGVHNGESNQKLATEMEDAVQIEKELKEEEEGAIQIERELRAEEENIESKNMSIGSTREVHSGGSSGSSSSSSSSDNEADIVEKKIVVAESGLAVDSIKPAESFQGVVSQEHFSVPAADTDNAVVEIASTVEQDVVSLKEEEVNVKESASIDYSVDSSVVELNLQENGEKKNENTVVSPVLGNVGSQEEDDVLHNSILSEEADDGATETSYVVEPDKVSLIKEVVNVNDNASFDFPLSSDVVESDLQENGDKLSLSNENTSVSPVSMDLGSHKKEDEVVPASNEKQTKLLDAKVSAAEVNNEHVLLTKDPRVHTSNGSEYVKDSRSTEGESQPIVASAPLVVQTTSWKSCCGIFELFTESNR